MDRREAIRVIKELLADRDNDSRYPCVSSPRHYEALDLAIEALQEPITIRKVVLEPTNPETLWEQGMRSLDGLEAELFVKEKHQLSGETPTISEKESVVGDAESATTTDCISRADAIAYIDRIFNSGLGRRKSLDYIRKYISALPPVNQKQITGKLENDENATSESEESTMDQPKSKLDCISRQQAIEALTGWQTEPLDEDIVRTLESLPPVEDIGEVSDGYHTFNQLYHQRAVLFATIVNQNKDKAWKSWKHEDGKFCFDKGGEWFIVGIDTPEGSYTYHYEKKYWDLFDCEELDRGKHWDGHTEEDVTRLLSLPQVEPKQSKGEWKYGNGNGECPFCGRERQLGWDNFCGFCGADMRGEK